MSSVLGGIAAKLMGLETANPDGFQSVPDMLGTVFNVDGHHGTSLTETTKKTLIGSNTYIESTLQSEDAVMVPLMAVLAQTYVGYILTALQIFQSVDRYKTISETMGRVGTEALSVGVESFEELDPKLLIDNAFAGTEAVRDERFRNDVDENVKHLAAGRLIEFDFVVNENATTTVEKQDNGFLRKPTEKETTVKKEIIGGAKRRTSGIVTVPIYVQLYPTSMPPDVAEALVQFNYPERFWRRVAKTAAREIYFFKDFILGMDMVRRHHEVLKQDSNNVLGDFYKDKITKQYRRVMDIFTGRKRNNIANSIVIITADTFKKINDEASIDLNNYADRQRFFSEAYAMMMVVVDTNFNMVDIYYNAIPKKSEMPFRAIKSAGNSKQGVDMEELMNTIAKGAAPKF